MDSGAIFWALAGIMAGIAVSFVLGALRLRMGAVLLRYRVIAIVVVAVMCGTAFLIYHPVGTPQVTASTAQQTTPAAHAAGSSGEDMATVTAKLAARLRQGGGSDADWQLLQQSYEFLGDKESAQLAAQHRLPDLSALPERANVSAALDAMVSTEATAPKTKTTSTPATDTSQRDLLSYQQRVARNARDAEAWAGIAALQRRARDFGAARAAYEKLIGLGAMNADAWADYADVVGSAGGSLADPAARKAIDAALKLEPRHTKALWLKATLAYSEKRYGDAVALWQQLRAAIPDTSPDARIIDANLAEARALSSQKSAPTVMPVSNPATTEVKVSGSVTVAPALKSRLQDDLTLLVFAKAPSSPGPPVAVLKTSIGAWPAAFVLNDALAMLPSRMLSQFDTVTVEARLSHSGQAMAQSGDLKSAAVTVATHAAKPVMLVINEVVK